LIKTYWWRIIVLLLQPNPILTRNWKKGGKFRVLVLWKSN
jgi:hypothetical protein